MLRVAHCLGEPNRSRGMSRAQRLRSVTTSRRLRARMPSRRSGKRRCGRCGRTHSTDEYDTLRELGEKQPGAAVGCRLAIFVTPDPHSSTNRDARDPAIMRRANFYRSKGDGVA